MPTITRKAVGFIVVGVLITAVIVFCVVYFSITGSGSTAPEGSKGGDSPSTSAATGLDCDPEGGYGQGPISEAECLRRNCVYRAEGSPRCAFPGSGYGYTVTGEEDTALGSRLRLQRVGRGPFGPDLQQTFFDVEMLHNDVLHFKLDAINGSRYHVPLQLDLPSTRATTPQYEVVIVDRQIFSFQVKRKATGTVIWDTSLGGLTFADQFLQIATRLPSKNVYGFGENLHKSFRHNLNATWSLWARDQPPGFTASANLYGVHPFYTCVEDSAGNTHGVLLLNSNAQDYAFSPLPSLTYRTIGGILDFYVFLGPTSEQVVQQYTQAVGRPYMPPYWALGFQLSRYGYNNIDSIKTAVANTRKYSIPQEVQYVDIDHMEEEKDFTVDHVNFPGLNDYFKELQAGGMRIIIILDPCLVANTTYEPYILMRNADAYIKWPDDVTPPANSSDDTNAMLGAVWPNEKTVFPDFLKNATHDVWKQLIVKHHSSLVFDGLWIDMNEPAVFGTNEEKPFNWPENKPPWSLKCGTSQWDDPPYRTKAAYLYDKSTRKGRLSDKTLCLTGVQGEGGQYRHYDVHSLYGWSQTRPTLDALREATKERGIVISRSTFPGSGKYAGHWLGDNDSEWSDMADSIIGMLEFNLFGIPYIGADICGFFANTTAELCLRWMQLGTFNPFFRNHNGIGFRAQDPGSFDDVVGNMSREAVETRYWLLPYLYTLFHEAHTKGQTVVRPLHHEFPQDELTLGIDRQFLWGAALLIAPILEQGQTVLHYYLPEGRWYNFFTHTESSGPANLSQAVGFQSRPGVFLRGGHVIPLQAPANNTHFSRLQPFTLLVALDNQNSASGKLFWDDGKTVDTFEKGKYYLATYLARQGSLQISVKRNDEPEVASNQLHYDVIRILGVKEPVTNVNVYSGSKRLYVTFTVVNQVLTVQSKEGISLSTSVSVHWGLQPR